MSLRRHLQPRTTDAATKPISYNADMYSKVYNFPALAATASPVIGVISLGGGIYTGDMHTYWSSIGIPTTQHPNVVIVPVSGAVNAPNVNDDGATTENALDIQILGANCASANTTILLYIAPCTFSGFFQAFNMAINNKVSVNGKLVAPTVISCSWGAPEKSYPPPDLARFNALFATAVAKGINICAATGDEGSSNGLPGLNVDFPASSPNIIACGGTTVNCPSLVYGPTTTETAWSLGGGGISAVFPAPAWQAPLKLARRATPDIAMNADPNTGINIMIGGKISVVGGTSAVAPAMAAYIARLGTDKFIIPRMYAASAAAATYAACFNDIKAGSNGAYSAKVVHDCCTGLGSLKGTPLKPLIA